MDATFRTGEGATVGVMATATENTEVVFVKVDVGARQEHAAIALTKSEARAVASALMGAAAEL